MKKGFTLLELIIALGIGALIITTVMISAQGAERSSRDGRRRADLNKLSGALEQWATNHNGLYPRWGTDWSGSGGVFVTDGYFTPTKQLDPKTQGQYAYASGDPTCSNISSTEAGKIFYKNTDSSSPRDFTLKMCIESGVYTLESKN